MLSGSIKSLDDLSQNDPRRMWPRFQPENFAVNIKLVDEMRGLAEKKGCTSAQFAINWVLSLSSKPGMPQFMPIPGSSNESRVRENSFVSELTSGEMAAVNEILSKVTVSGGRYPEGIPVDG